MLRNARIKTRKTLSVISSVTVFILVVVTLGIPLNQHYCGGKLFSQKIYETVEPCGMVSESQSDNQPSIGYPPCCYDKHELLSASGLDNDGPETSEVPTNSLPEVFEPTMVHTWNPPAQIHTAYLGNTSPPGPSRNFVVEFGIFLI